VLPDVLKPNLRLVFCGTAAGKVSAERGHYYAHSRNKFWETLCKVELTRRQFQPHEYRQLIRAGIGLTDIAKHVYGMDNELPRGSLNRKAATELRERILRYRPKVL